MSIFDWAEEDPEETVKTDRPNRMKWKDYIATGLFLMKEKGFSQAQARELIVEKENLTEKQAVSFKVCFNRHIRKNEIKF